MYHTKSASEDFKALNLLAPAKFPSQKVFTQTWTGEKQMLTTKAKDRIKRAIRTKKEQSRVYFFSALDGREATMRIPPKVFPMFGEYKEKHHIREVSFTIRKDKLNRLYVSVVK